jgi:hypothetical protein
MLHLMLQQRVQHKLKKDRKTLAFFSRMAKPLAGEFDSVSVSNGY